MADTLLRAGGGSTATLLISPVQGDTADAGQIGLDAPGFQALAIGPVSFRRTRPVMSAGTGVKYELLLSATAVEQQISVLQLNSAEALFGMVAGVQIAGLVLELEQWAATAQMGEPVLYRLVLRPTATAAVTAQS